MLIPAECAAARALLGISGKELARRAKVSPNHIAKLERGQKISERTIAKLRVALEKAGVALIVESPQ